MQYLGSKASIAKHIIPIVSAHRKPGDIWIEPFVGGCNIIDKVDGQRIGNDFNKELVALWLALQNGWIPPDTLTKEEYQKIRYNQSSYPPELVCFAGLLCSFGGKWFGGYAFNSKGDNYAARGMRVLLKQKPLIDGITFTNMNYLDMVIPSNAVVYMDPPYANTTNYKMSFDHKIFWNWVREKSKTNPVFVSEYNAPDDFECLIEIPVKTKLDKNSNYPRMERLFRVKL